MLVYTIAPWINFSCSSRLFVQTQPPENCRFFKLFSKIFSFNYFVYFPLIISWISFLNFGIESEFLISQVLWFSPERCWFETIICNQWFQLNRPGSFFDPLFFDDFWLVMYETQGHNCMINWYYIPKSAPFFILA